MNEQQFRVISNLKINVGSNQKKFRVSCRLLPELPHMLESCDYVCNVLPSTPDTRGLLSGETLKHCQNKVKKEKIHKHSNTAKIR